jgi:hypothetical protein
MESHRQGLSAEADSILKHLDQAHSNDERATSFMFKKLGLSSDSHGVLKMLCEHGYIESQPSPSNDTAYLLKSKARDYLRGEYTPLPSSYGVQKGITQTHEVTSKPPTPAHDSRILAAERDRVHTGHTQVAVVEPKLDYATYKDHPLLRGKALIAEGETMPMLKTVGVRFVLTLMDYHDCLPLPVLSGFLLGSKSDLNHIVLENKFVSHIHCRFRVARTNQTGYKLYVQDMNSTNGTFVDDLRLQPDQVVALRHGAKLNIATKYTFIVSQLA